MKKLRPELIQNILICLVFFLGSNGRLTAQVTEEDSILIDAVWIPDNGDGTYTNPILYADYSDPDIVKLDDDFYMVASSFNCVPGVPVLHSKDLVNWTIIAHVFNNQPPDSIYDDPGHGVGVWAPSIRYHKGEFYVYYANPD
jgi:beta-xylosidase